MKKIGEEVVMVRDLVFSRKKIKKDTSDEFELFGTLYDL